MVTLDTRGKVCPFPLVEAKNLVQTLKSGEELEILLIVHRLQKQSHNGLLKKDMRSLILNF